MAKVIIDLDDLEELKEFEKLKVNNEQLLIKNKSLRESLLNNFRYSESLQQQINQLESKLQEYKNKSFWQRIINK